MNKTHSKGQFELGASFRPWKRIKKKKQVQSTLPGAFGYPPSPPLLLRYYGEVPSRELRDQGDDAARRQDPGAFAGVSSDAGALAGIIAPALAVDSTCAVETGDL